MLWCPVRWSYPAAKVKSWILFHIILKDRFCCYSPAQLRSVSMSSPVSKIRINKQNKKELCPNSQLLGREEHRCSLDSCSNRGVCVQQWNTFFCYCQLTSYSGPTCSDGISIFRAHTHRQHTTSSGSPERSPCSYITATRLLLSLSFFIVCSLTVTGILFMETASCFFSHSIYTTVSGITN